MKKKLICFILCIIIILLVSCTLRSYAYSADWNVYNTVNSTLPDDRVHDIAIDAKGIIWIATEGGLASFDIITSEWHIYNKMNSGLPDNYVTTLCIDEDEVLWIGTDAGGLTRYDIAADTWYVFNVTNSSIPGNHISTIAIDIKGTKWIGSYSWLATFDDTTWTLYTTSNSNLPVNQIQDIAVDASGTAWIGTLGHGLAKFDGTTVFTYDTSLGLPDHNVRSVCIDANDNKWIGTDGGIAVLSGYFITAEYTLSNTPLPENSVHAIAIETINNKWFGAGGLVKFNGSTWTSFTTTNSGFPSDKVSAIAVDTNKRLWIATLDKGVVSYKENDVTTTTTTTTSGVICPAIAVLGKENPDLQVLYDLRDRVLSKNIYGIYCTILYYKHAREITDILIIHPDLYKDVKILISDFLPVFREAIAGINIVVNEDSMQRTVILLDNLSAYGSVSLQNDIKILKWKLTAGYFLKN